MVLLHTCFAIPNLGESPFLAQSDFGIMTWNFLKNLTPGLNFILNKIDLRKGFFKHLWSLLTQKRPIAGAALDRSWRVS